MKVLNEEQQKQLDEVKKELITLAPDQKEMVESMDNQVFLNHLEINTIPGLMGSFEGVRATLANLMLLVANLNKRDKYTAYIEALDDISAFIDSYSPSYLPGCKHYEVTGQRGNAEIKHCILDPENHCDCHKTLCSLPEEEKPAEYKLIDCPVCEGALALSCNLCFNIGTLEKGKLCPECKGTQINCDVCHNTRVNPNWEE